MVEWMQHNKNVFTTEEMRDLEQFIAQAGGHIVGVVNAYKGVIVTYRLPIKGDEE